jgi:parallel beta-helix repeat protein
VNERSIKFISVVFIYIFIAIVTQADAAVITVDLNGEGNYSSIQEAINNAQDGDTILVSSGVYQENLEINKELTILSHSTLADNRTKTYIIGAVPGDNVFNIYSSNVTIDGFCISGGSSGTDRYESGIYLEGVQDCSLKNNILIQNDLGISLNGSKDNIIVNNLASLGNYGISLTDSQRNLISKNLLVTNNQGISLDNSVNNTIVNNTADSNSIGVFLRVSKMNTLAYNLIIRNKYGIFGQNAKSNLLFSNRVYLDDSGVYFNDSSNNTVFRNEFINFVNAIDEGNDYRSGFINFINTVDEGKNLWNSSTAGNYWHDYTGQDVDSNGIGDTPYLINEITGTKDYMPLVNETFSGSNYGNIISSSSVLTDQLNKNYFAGLNEVQEGGTVVEITELGQINTSLEKGPVFLRLGAEWCPLCRSMKPIMNELAEEYGGKAVVMSADLDRNPEFKSYFGVQHIPDSFVIVDIEDGSYIYIQENGNISKDRFQARVVGLKNKQVFERLLDVCLLNEMKDKSDKM